MKFNPYYFMKAISYTVFIILNIAGFICWFNDIEFNGHPIAPILPILGWIILAGVNMFTDKEDF